MQKFFMLIIGVAMITTSILSTQTSAQKAEPNINLSTLFTYPNADFYWEALVQVAKGNKEEALKIASALQENLPIAIASSWKEKLPQNIDDFFDKLLLTTISRDPQSLSMLGLFESIGIREHNKALNNVSVHAILENIEITKSDVALLNYYSTAALSQEQKISHKIFAWKMNHTIAGEQFLLHTYIINQFDSILQKLTLVFTQFHQLNDHEDIECYIVRLGKIPKQFKQAIEFLELQQHNGMLPPRFMIEKVITLIDKFTTTHINENIFYQHLAQQSEKIAAPDQKNLLAKAHNVIEQYVYPAYRQLQSYFIQLRDKTSANNGVWALPEGEQYYAYMLKQYTTTHLSADEIHAIGLAEVQKIQHEIRHILAAENIVDSQKSVGALLQGLSKNSCFYYPNTQEGRKECLADYERILARSRTTLGHLFNVKPQIKVKIERVPLHEEDAALCGYYWMPSIDGSRQGTFFANLRDMAEVPKYNMETLAIHEAEPGHHFQLALQYEMKIPTLRKLGIYDAYCEGWALYTEKLAYEYGFYSSSFSALGHLQFELLRAARLVVDTGIHHKRWTYERAITYMEETTGLHHNSVVSEVERYFVMPGQACAYKIGQLKIIELREHAQEKLREKFDIREFHDAILQVANVPLTILEEVIEQYITEKLALP